MKTLVISDIHGNLPALERVLEIEKEATRVICLGDVVNYGPWSNECVDLLDSLDDKILLMGNHEKGYFIEKTRPKHPLVQMFTEKCIVDFMRFEKIEEYAEKYYEGDVMFIHTLNDLYIYPDTNIELSQNIIIGHSHYQYRIENNGYFLCNPGSVGQNRQYIDLINYAVIDGVDDKIELKSLNYNVDLLINEMKSKKYKQECIDYYLNKPRVENK